MKIAIVAATNAEIIPDLNDFQRPGDEFVRLITGVGMVNMTYALTKCAYQDQPDAFILLGIAGSFTSQLPLNAVVAVENEFLGDMGVMENEQWKDIFDLELADPHQAPYQQKALKNPFLKEFNLRLPAVNSVSVNCISTNAQHILTLQNYYNVQIESMEGAAFHHVMLDMQKPFLQIRAISNAIGERDKSKWAIGPSIHALNQTCIDLLNNGLFK